jgi:cytosine/adenosine deaminase-related metal-dependent hydrolase
MLQIVLAPCSPFSVTADLMRESARMARHYGIHLHTHLCETLDEERYTLAHMGLRPVAYMESLDWVGNDVWYAHAVHVDDAEIRLFARKGAGVCHCPSSNMRLASGIAPVKAYRDAGVRLGLGVDGAASNDGSNLLGEARQAMLLARLKIGLPPPAGPDTDLSTSDPLRAKEWMTGREALEIATIGGASVLGRGDIGSLCGGLERSGGGRRVLRADARPPHRGGRAADRGQRRDRHPRHGADDPRTQSQCRAAGAVGVVSCSLFYLL